MKSVVIISIVLTGFYIGASKLLLTQIQAMQDFYSHADQYASQALQNTTDKPITVRPLQTMSNPGSKIIGQ